MKSSKHPVLVLFAAYDGRNYPAKLIRQRQGIASIEYQVRGPRGLETVSASVPRNRLIPALA